MLRIYSSPMKETTRWSNMLTATLVALVLLASSLTLSAQTGRPERADSTPVKTVYIIPTSHYDFGFVEPPDAVRERAARHIDEVIRVAEADPDFRWTIESIWQVNEWLKR